jgi:hypothetical protein
MVPNEKKETEKDSVLAGVVLSGRYFGRFLYQESDWHVETARLHLERGFSASPKHWRQDSASDGKPKASDREFDKGQIHFLPR